MQPLDPRLLSAISTCVKAQTHLPAAWATQRFSLVLGLSLSGEDNARTFRVAHHAEAHGSYSSTHSLVYSSVCGRTEGCAVTNHPRRRKRPHYGPRQQWFLVGADRRQQRCRCSSAGCRERCGRTLARLHVGRVSLALVIWGSTRISYETEKLPSSAIPTSPATDTSLALPPKVGDEAGSGVHGNLPRGTTNTTP